VATVIYSLSLHDALPIFGVFESFFGVAGSRGTFRLLFDLGRDMHVRGIALRERRYTKREGHRDGCDKEQRPAVSAHAELDGKQPDRKSTRLNSSHDQISY